MVPFSFRTVYLTLQSVCFTPGRKVVPEVLFGIPEVQGTVLKSTLTVHSTQKMMQMITGIYCSTVLLFGILL